MAFSRSHPRSPVPGKDFPPAFPFARGGLGGVGLVLLGVDEAVEPQLREGHGDVVLGFPKAPGDAASVHTPVEPLLRVFPDEK